MQSFIYFIFYLPLELKFSTENPTAIVPGQRELQEDSFGRNTLRVPEKVPGFLRGERTVSFPTRQNILQCNTHSRYLFLSE